MFQNPEISLDELPSVDTVDWQPMHKSLALQLFLQEMIFFAFIAGVSMGIRLLPSVTLMPVWIHLLILLTIFVPMAVWPFASVRRRGIAFRERDILYKSGILIAKVTAVPFNRIQHVETKQGPLDRRFGTAGLQIFTAGGSKGDLAIEGLEAGLAEKLRGQIMRRIEASVESD